jgi:hypothetical protein
VSCLRQWPVQIKLLPAEAPFYQGAKLLDAADCTAFSRADFHHRFMRGRITLIGCPKLDEGDYHRKAHGDPPPQRHPVRSPWCGWTSLLRRHPAAARRPCAAAEVHPLAGGDNWAGMEIFWSKGDMDMTRSSATPASAAVCARHLPVCSAWETTGWPTAAACPPARRSWPGRPGTLPCVRHHHRGIRTAGPARIGAGPAASSSSHLTPGCLRECGVFPGTSGGPPGPATPAGFRRRGKLSV